MEVDAGGIRADEFFNPSSGGDLRFIVEIGSLREPVEILTRGSGLVFNSFLWSQKTPNKGRTTVTN